MWSALICGHQLNGLVIKRSTKQIIEELEGKKWFNLLSGVILSRCGHPDKLKKKIKEIVWKNLQFFSMLVWFTFYDVCIIRWCDLVQCIGESDTLHHLKKTIENMIKVYVERTDKWRESKLFGEFCKNISMAASWSREFILFKRRRNVSNEFQHNPTPHPTYWWQ